MTQAHSEATRKYYANHREYYAEYHRKYDEEHREQRRLAKLKYRTSEKSNANHFVERHCELDKKCELCPSTENLIGHHPDYKYPEIFVTCCESCHSFIHRGIY